MGNLHLFYFFKRGGTLREAQRYAEEEMIILSESTEQIEAFASASENKLMTEAAQFTGISHILALELWNKSNSSELCWVI